MSYTKTNKLITALYMVTDIIDKDEPLRNKLRTLGVQTISDINYTPALACGRISEIMSFLDIASAMNIISLMNCNILRKEFYELDQSIRQSTGKTQILSKQIDLEEFLKSDNPTPSLPKGEGRNRDALASPFGGGYGGGSPKGQTHLGVQKGSTLLKSIKDISHVSEISKRQRREDILYIIKTNGGSATIKDIKDKIQLTPDKFNSLASCGEKTLQRMLFSMVKDGVLLKEGAKRWSRYFLK